MAQDVNPDTLMVPFEDGGELKPLSEYEKRFVALETDKDQRRRTRLPRATADDPTAEVNPKLCYELALEMGEPAETFAKYGYDADAAVKLLARHDFQIRVKQYRDEIVASGTSFKLKARVQAEALLADSYDLATDPEAPATVRADLIKWTAAVAGLGPDTSKKGEGGAGGAEFHLNITFSGSAPAAAPAIDVTPTKEIQ